MSAVKVGGTTIHFGLGITTGIKYFNGSNYKSKAALRNRLSGVKFLIIGQLSTMSSDLSTYIDSRLGEIFMMIHEKTFAGLSVMVVLE